MQGLQRETPLNDHPRFGLEDVLVDPPALRIVHGDQVQSVEAKVMRVLLVLARTPGAVVSRRELEAAVWPGRILSEDAVTSAIGKLRKALNDDARRPRFIETIAKSGYRLKVDPVIAFEPSRAGTTFSPNPPGWRAVEALRSYGLGLPLVVALITASLTWTLWQSASGPEAGRRAVESIAVVPFDVLDDDRSQTYLAEGITLDLITELSRFPELLVIAPGTVFGYRDTLADDEAIAAELGVGYLIRGGVQRVGDQLRVNVRLLQANRGVTLWAERFVGEAGGLFDMQDRIVAGIARALPDSLSLPPRPLRRRGATQSIVAYDEFLRGLEHYGRRTPADNAVARRHFEQALALDPGFARAHAGLALAWSRLAIDGWTDDPDGALAKAAELADRAASIDPSVPQIHFVRGQVALFAGRHDEAAASAMTAIEIDPNYADAYALLAWILQYAGRPDRAEPALLEALRRNPNSSASYQEIAGEIHFTTARYAEAAEAFQQALESNPAHMRARLWLAATLVELGRMEEARWEVQELLQINPDFSLSRLLMAFPLKDPRRQEALTTALSRLGLPE